MTRILPKHSAKTKLFDFDFCASFFQFLLGFFSISFADAFLDWLRCGINHIFGFFQTQTGDFTNGFNNANLVSTEFSQNDGEFSLFFSSSTTGSTGTSTSSKR